VRDVQLKLKLEKTKPLVLLFIVLFLMVSFVVQGYVMAQDMPQLDEVDEDETFYPRLKAIVNVTYTESTTAEAKWSYVGLYVGIHRGLALKLSPVLVDRFEQCPTAVFEKSLKLGSAKPLLLALGLTKDVQVAFINSPGVSATFYPKATSDVAETPSVLVDPGEDHAFIAEYAPEDFFAGYNKVLRNTTDVETSGNVTYDLDDRDLSTEANKETPLYVFMWTFTTNNTSGDSKVHVVLANSTSSPIGYKSVTVWSEMYRLEENYVWIRIDPNASAIQTQVAAGYKYLAKIKVENANFKEIAIYECETDFADSRYLYWDFGDGETYNGTSGITMSIGAMGYSIKAINFGTQFRNWIMKQSEKIKDSFKEATDALGWRNFRETMLDACKKALENSGIKVSSITDHTVKSAKLVFNAGERLCKKIYDTYSEVASKAAGATVGDFAEAANKIRSKVFKSAVVAIDVGAEALKKAGEAVKKGSAAAAEKSISIWNGLVAGATKLGGKAGQIVVNAKNWVTKGGKFVIGTVGAFFQKFVSWISKWWWLILIVVFAFVAMIAYIAMKATTARPY